jgi:hypothetical protein
MAAKIETVNRSEILLEGLCDQLKRIPSRFQERMQEHARRQNARIQGGRYTAYDFPEAAIHGLKVQIK